MGKRGPAKTPSSIKKREGTYRSDRDGGQVERVPLRQPPDPPEFVRSFEQIKWFHHFAVQIWRMGVLCAEDVDAVGYLALDHCDYLQARDALEINGSQFQTNHTTGIVSVHPAVKVRNDAHTRVQSAFQQFYLTPASRARANLVTPPAPKGSGWSRGRPKGVSPGDRGA